MINTSNQTTGFYAPPPSLDGTDKDDQPKKSVNKISQAKKITKYVLAVIIVLVLIGGGIAGYLLSQQPQDVRQKASTGSEDQDSQNPICSLTFVIPSLTPFPTIPGTTPPASATQTVPSPTSGASSEDPIPTQEADPSPTLANCACPTALQLVPSVRPDGKYDINLSWTDVVDPDLRVYKILYCSEDPTATQTACSRQGAVNGLAADQIGHTYKDTNNSLGYACNTTLRYQVRVDDSNNNWQNCTEQSCGISPIITSACATTSVAPTATLTPTPTVTFACNSTCTTDADCQTVNAEYICSAEAGNKCRLDSNRDSTTCSARDNTYVCNSACQTTDQCKNGNSSYICSTTNGNVCRLASNEGASNCLPVNYEPADTLAGCNESCQSNSNCAYSNYICYSTSSGDVCRLDQYPNSSTCRPPAVVNAYVPPAQQVYIPAQQIVYVQQNPAVYSPTLPEFIPTPAPRADYTPYVASDQPALPTELPQTGPADWSNWLKAGLVTLGLGAALLLLL